MSPLLLTIELRSQYVNLALSQFTKNLLTARNGRRIECSDCCSGNVLYLYRTMPFRIEDFDAFLSTLQRKPKASKEWAGKTLKKNLLNSIPEKHCAFFATPAGGPPRSGYNDIMKSTHDQIQKSTRTFHLAVLQSMHLMTLLCSMINEAFRCCATSRQ